MPMLLESLKDREVAHDGRRFILRNGRDGRSEAVIECLEAKRHTRYGAAIFQELILDACIADLLGDSGPHSEAEIGYALAYFYDRATDEGEGVKMEHADAAWRDAAGDRRRSG
jgi:hypothetical protein